MSTPSDKPAFSRISVALFNRCYRCLFCGHRNVTVGAGAKHNSIIFFCSVILTSWYGGLLPGLFAASLSWLALDYYFIPPIHSLAMNPEEVPGIITFGAADPASAAFASWPIDEAVEIAEQYGGQALSGTRQLTVQRSEFVTRLEHPT
jgi:K+-sensing histidine kinase KdpD